MAEIQRLHKMDIKKKSYVCKKSVNHTIFERHLTPSHPALMEDHSVNFKKDDIYILMGIEKEDDFTLYYLVPLSESHHRVVAPEIFCEDVNSEDVPFSEIFTEIEIERARRINQVLYED